MIDQYPSANGVLTSLIWRKTATGGETSLSGYDNSNQALSYTPGQEQVYLNGILLVRGDDYTATNGTSITGLSALSASDYVQVNCYNNFSVASVPVTSLIGTISNSQLDSTVVTTTGNQTLTNKTLTAPVISTINNTGTITLPTSTGTLALTSGVINNTLTTTTGDIIYASYANTPARLGVGSTGQVLTVSGGIPAWTTLTAAKALQVVSASTATTTATTSGSYVDATGLTLSITPSATSSKILILVDLLMKTERDNYPNGLAQIVRNSTAIYTGEAFTSNIGSVSPNGSPKFVSRVPMIYLDSPNTTSATTYKVQISIGATGVNGTTTANGTIFGSAISSITAIEIGA